jgi:hypothetical protein
MGIAPGPASPRPKFDLERPKLEGTLALRRRFSCDFSQDARPPAKAQR